MKREDIFTIIQDKIEYLEKTRIHPKAIIVSESIYRDIYSGSYKTDGSDPFVPDFTQYDKTKYDKLFGLKLAVVNTNDTDFIEVYTKG